MENSIKMERRIGLKLWFCIIAFLTNLPLQSVTITKRDPWLIGSVVVHLMDFFRIFSSLFLNFQLNSICLLFIRSHLIVSQRIYIRLVLITLLAYAISKSLPLPNRRNELQNRLFHMVLFQSLNHFPAYALELFNSFETLLVLVI